MQKLMIVLLFILSLSALAEPVNQKKLRYFHRNENIQRFLDNFLVSKVIITGEWSDENGMSYPYYQVDESCVNQMFARIGQLYNARWSKLFISCIEPNDEGCAEGIRFSVEVVIGGSMYRAQNSCPGSLISEPKELKLQKVKRRK